MQKSSSLVVQKYGGSSVATPEQIRLIAKKICDLRQTGTRVIVVVSAMGDTTDDLVRLAERVARVPNRRELDMLLSTGERVTMALMSMALHDHACPSISFTGSQAGILTDSSHNNARIFDIKPLRLSDTLQNESVVVLAGFQGVNPVTKEVTTLGRGGSDLTAVAMAAYFGADRCEILKDVDGIFSGDPRVVKNARRLTHIDFVSLLEMTFWGSQVLHHRSVELAWRKNVSLWVGPAHGNSAGTFVGSIPPNKDQNINEGDLNMYEQCEILGVNSHTEVRNLLFKHAATLGEAMTQFQALLQQHQLPWPQILSSEPVDSLGWKFLFTGATETISSLKNILDQDSSLINLDPQKYSTVSVTCFGSVASDLQRILVQKMESHSLFPLRVLLSPQSLTVIVHQSEREPTMACAHQLLGRVLI